jgi:Zn-dependent protease/CBS domain-containing protein
MVSDYPKSVGVLYALFAGASQGMVRSLSYYKDLFKTHAKDCGKANKVYLLRVFFMKYSFRIGSVWGIPIELHITFILLMVVAFVFTYPELYFFALILFLFAFVVAHELAHSVVARHYKIKVRKIVLYPIGGVSEIEEIPEKPSIEWRMAIAGPVTSFVIGGVLLALDQAISIEMPPVFLTPTFSTAESLIFNLATLNLLLGAFNLIPAFPMDGGRVFRALLAERIKFSDATKYAAFIGRLFGIAMVMVGVFFNFWLIIIGVFIYIGASEEAEQTIVSTTLARVRVKDVMFSEVAFVKPETKLEEALEGMLKARYHDIPIEKDGAYQGIVTWNEILKVKREERGELQVGKLPLRQVSVFSDESILEAYKIMTREKIDLVPVVDRQAPAKVVGALTSEGVAYAYEKAKTLR